MIQLGTCALAYVYPVAFGIADFEVWKSLAPLSRAHYISDHRCDIQNQNKAADLSRMHTTPRGPGLLRA